MQAKDLLRKLGSKEDESERGTAVITQFCLTCHIYMYICSLSLNEINNLITICL